MTEFEVLRKWLSEQKGDLNEMSKRTGISRRTIQRIVNDEGYSVGLSTYLTLKGQMDAAIAGAEHESSAEA